MDFIERIFGIAPDGGNGLLELALCIGVLLIEPVWRLVHVLRRRRIAKWMEHELSSRD